MPSNPQHITLKSSDGSAWNWGLGTSGQLGDNTILSKSSPVSVVGAHSFNAIATGGGAAIGSSFALKTSDGSLWTWGASASGQLGDNTIQNRSSPVSVVGAHSFNIIAAGNALASALKTSDGSLWTWGANTNGWLGDNSIASRSSPISVVGAHSFNMIAQGGITTGGFSMALKSSDGSVWTWGLSTSGQLGENVSGNRSSPVSVVGAHSFNTIAAGGTHSMALKSSDGSVWNWGLGTSGQLGESASAVSRSSPVSVVGTHSFNAVSAGGTQSMALKSSDGSVWTWGLGTSGQLGDGGNFVSRSSPVSVVGAHSFVKIAMGILSGYALKTDGSIWAWGTRADGRLGDNTDSFVASPVAVVGSHNFNIVAGGNGAPALKSADGSAWTWGAGGNGVLGDNTATNKSSPVSVVGAHSFNAISGGRGGGSILALKSADGSAWTWGLGTSGELGDNTATSKSSPVSVVGTHSFNAIAAGSALKVALKSSDGSAWTWGAGTGGGLGDNQIAASRSSPVSVVGAHSFNVIAADQNHVKALKSADGSAWAWGTGTNGQSGDNTASSRSSPVSVVGTHSFNAISAGGLYSMALKSSDGSVWAWGNNAGGNLGDNSATQRSSPVSVVGAHSFNAIAAMVGGGGGSSSIALKSADGSAWTWGLGTSGELGDGTATSKSSPVSVVGAHSFTKISTGVSNAYAVKADGSVWSWGIRTSGVLGDNTSQFVASPVQVVQPTSAIKKMLNVTFNRSVFNDITTGAGTIKVVKTINGLNPDNTKSINGNT